MKKTVLAVLISNAFIVPAWADTETQTAELEAVTVTGDRQGMKIQTNVVTMHEMDESTETALRGLLEKEPAIDFGGGNGTSQHMTLR
nr:TonB-dependent siderophore receptor [Neisseria sp.]